MAGFTAIALASAGLIGAGAGAYQTIQGAKQAREAKRKIDNFEYPELDMVNPYEGMAVPTQGAEMQMERGAQRTATSLEALSKGGIRTLSGGVSDVAEQDMMESQEIANYMNQMQFEIDKLTAGFEGQLQQQETQIRERRAQQELAGYGALYQQGQEMKYGGMEDITQSLMAGANLAAGMQTPKSQPENFGNTNYNLPTRPYLGIDQNPLTNY